MMLFRIRDRSAAIRSGHCSHPGVVPACRVPGWGAAQEKPPVTHRSLSQRLRIANGLLIAAVVVLGTTAISSLIALRIDTDNAIEEYREMRMLSRAEAGLRRARLQLRLAELDSGALVGELTGAREQLAGFVAAHESEADEVVEHGELEQREQQSAQMALKRIDGILGRLDGAPASDPPDGAGISQSLDAVLARLEGMGRDPDLAQVQAQATRQTWVSVGVVGVLSLVIISATVAISGALHRRIVGSIRRLQAGAREIASGRFSQRVPERGDEEIVALARDFNQMASQLDALYHGMERRIEHKSRELVRSERLASVGFLAAGVSHEINNPLGIISGYATMARGWLSGTPTGHQMDEARDALDIIRDEAFRCKKIVEQLVTLSMFGGGTRESVSLKQIVGELVSLVRGLDRARLRRIVYEDDTAGQFMVMANPVELKQVVLNLIVNALEATDARTGRVDIHTHRSNGHVILTVSDNGCGIAPDAIGNIFEPFFTNHRDGENHRLGLGMTISHAIVQAHGGKMSIRSDGPGRGSQVIVELPEHRDQEQAHDDEARHAATQAGAGH